MTLESQQEGWTHLLRGPIIISAVVVSLATPYLSQLSSKFILQLSVALLAFLWLCYDFFIFVEGRFRTNFRNFLDGVVLDDVLRAIHDPETGIVACIVGTFVGTSSMYALRMNTEQRTKLVGASLCTSDNEARTVLLTPGGLKTLLPATMQIWLNEGENVTEMNLEPDINKVHDDYAESDISSSECGANSEDNCNFSDEPQSRSRGGFSSKHTATPGTTGAAAASNGESGANSSKNPHSRGPRHPPIDPLTVMVTILKELAREQIIKPYIQSIPESALESVGVSAGAVLALQLAIRRRSKASFLSSVSALALTGIVTGAFSTVLARHAVLGNIHNMDSLQTVGKAVVLRIFEKLKRTAVNSTRWKGILAMLIFLLIGKQPSSSGATLSR